MPGVSRRPMKVVRRVVRLVFLGLLSGLFSGMVAAEQADMVIHGGTIYTVGKAAQNVPAVAVADGRILALGSERDMLALAADDARIIDLQGATMTPGFIDSHGHLMSLGHGKLRLDLNGVETFDELVAMVAEAAKRTPPGEWILGRGWHQSKWSGVATSVKGFPVHHALSAATPDHPVYLTHASGHAAFVNAAAMRLAGLDADTEFDESGEIIKDDRGAPTGILNERAQTLVSRLIPQVTPERDRLALDAALAELARFGITGFHDAGMTADHLELVQSYAREGRLNVRLYVLLSGRDPQLLARYFARGPLIDPWVTVRAIKLVADGALGSRGAWLTESYEDRAEHYGNAVTPPADIRAWTERAYKAGFQVGVHAIGDRANHEVLNIFEAVLDGDRKARFRIEHAQHILPRDIPRFGRLGVIAAMQAIHMSSDRPWAIDRLGRRRIEDGAYMWQALLQSGAVVANGTDVPVEPVDPIASFFASVTRQTLKGEPPGGYEPSQKMTRAQALRSYTLDAAYAAFEEDRKGSIEVGKLADFTVFDRDIMQVPDKQLLDTRVRMTIVGGSIVYEL